MKMASKLTKLVVFAAVAGAAAAGVHYYMQKKEAELKAEGFADDVNVFDGEPAASKKRTYVNLNLDNIESTLNKAKEKITDSYNYVRDSVKAGFEGGSRGQDFVDLAEEENGDAPADEEETADVIKVAEEKLADAANEGVTKVENFFDEEE
jgi:hypothetical protein